MKNTGQTIRITRIRNRSKYVLVRNIMVIKNNNSSSNNNNNNNNNNNTNNNNAGPTGRAV